MNSGQLRLTLFGVPTLTVVGSEPIALSQKAMALLCFLKCSEQTVSSREQIAEFLWENSASSNARTSLRQTLTEIRNALGENKSVISTDRRSVVLAADAISTDVDDLIADVWKGSVPDRLLSSGNVADKILSVYDNIGQSYSEWLRDLRTGLHSQLLRALRSGYERSEYSLETRRNMAECVLQLDPLSETAARALMKASAEEGDVGKALQVYANLYKQLDEDLGMEPSQPTHELVVQIKQGHFDAARPDPVPAKPSGPRHIPGQIRSGQPILAILPPRLMGPNTIPEFFAEMLVEDVIFRLVALRDLLVISSNSTRNFPVENVNFDQLHRQLNADYVLTSTMTDISGKMRLSMQLSDVRSNLVLWARNYMPAGRDFLETHGEIAADIAATFVPVVHQAVRGMSDGMSFTDMSAYQLVLRARELIFSLDRRTFGDAKTLLQEAETKDPNFFQVHVLQADWYSLLLGQGWSTDPVSDLRALEKSMVLAVSETRGNGRAIAMHGHNQAIYFRNYQRALDLFDQALELSPNDAETLLWSGPTLAYTANIPKAIERTEKAISLSPNDPLLFRYEHFASIAHFAAQDYEKAAELGRESYGRNPGYSSNLRVTAASLTAMGKIEEAQYYGQELLKVEPDFTISEYIKKQAFQSETSRIEFGRKLELAGLPL